MGLFSFQFLPGEEHAAVFPEDLTAEDGHLHLCAAPANPQHPLREYTKWDVAVWVNLRVNIIKKLDISYFCPPPPNDITTYSLSFFWGGHNIFPKSWIYASCQHCQKNSLSNSNNGVEYIWYVQVNWTNILTGENYLLFCLYMDSILPDLCPNFIEEEYYWTLCFKLFTINVSVGPASLCMRLSIFMIFGESPWGNFTCTQQRWHQ